MLTIQPLITQKYRKTVDSSTVFFNDKKIAEKNKKQPLLALLIEAGSSHVYMELVDLESYNTLAESSFETPMNDAAWDMLSRVEAIKSSETKPSVLSRDFFGKIKEEAYRLTEDTQSIFFIGLACNSPTAHIVMQQPVLDLGKTPEKLSSTPSFQKSFSELGFKDWGKGLVVTLPNINTFIGGDNLAALNVLELRELELVIDLGASCEFFLKKEAAVYATSCESRPIFEGYFLDLLEPLRPGSIVDFEIKEGIYTWKTYEDKPMSRFSIYGLLQLLSHFLQRGYINPQGKFSGNIPFKRVDNQLLLNEEARLYLSEKDIQVLRFVRGSIRSAITILMEKSQVELRDITGVKIIGQNKNYLFGDSLVKAGFLPKEYLAKMSFAGRPVIEGMKNWLKGQKLPVSSLDYSELSLVTGYYQVLAQAMQFDK